MAERGLAGYAGSYTPTTPANWGTPPPSTIQDGLDQLAGEIAEITNGNGVSAAGNTGTGGGTVTVTTGEITKETSGKILVTATVQGEQGTGGDVVTAQLKRDATNIGSPVACTPVSNGDVFCLAITFVDTAPDTAAHTYTLSVTGGGGNLTVAATSAQISAVELG